jgi:hypothetical protein
LDVDIHYSKLEKDYEFVLKSDAQYIEQFCKEDGVEFSLKNYFDCKDRNGNYAFPYEYEYNRAPSLMIFANSRTYEGLRSQFQAFKNLPGDIELAETKKIYTQYPRLIQAFKERFGEGESLL